MNKKKLELYALTRRNRCWTELVKYASFSDATVSRYLNELLDSGFVNKKLNKQNRPVYHRNESKLKELSNKKTTGLLQSLINSKLADLKALNKNKSLFEKGYNLGDEFTYKDIRQKIKKLPIDIDPEKILIKNNSIKINENIENYIKYLNKELSCLYNLLLDLRLV